MNGNVKGLGIGLLVGGVLGLLFAPRSGKETRAILKKGCETMKERVVEAIEEVGERSADAGHQVRHILQNDRQKMKLTNLVVGEKLASK